MAGVKGRSGRRKPLGKQIDEAMKLLDASLPELVSTLIDKASDGDRESLIYLIDRRLGKPRQQTDIDLTGGGEIGVGSLVKLLEMIQRAKRIESGDIIDATK